jgi:hypothetical protein
MTMGKIDLFKVIYIDSLSIKEGIAIPHFIHHFKKGSPEGTPFFRTQLL